MTSKAKCRYCGKRFDKGGMVKVPLGYFCTFEHATLHGMRKSAAKAKRQKAAQDKADRERIKTKADHAREAQAAFNAYIRERDKDHPCISCGRHHNGQYHAGHFRTVGAHPELRFNELNCHKQCAPCNNHLSGNIVEYRINLAQKIGHAKLEWLEGPHEPKKYTIEELKQIKAEYKSKLKALKDEADY